jgi:hypothetical protein
MLTMIYMTRIQNMSVFLLKVNNPSVHHPVWSRVAPVWPPSGTPSGPHLAPVGQPRVAPVWPLSGTPVCPSVLPSVWPRPAPSLASLKGINLLKFA